jgi:hypothetical protein
MTAFLVARGKDNSNASHVKKIIIASLNYSLSLFGLPNLCDHRDLYQLFDRAKKIILFIDYNNYVFFIFSSNGRRGQRRILTNFLKLALCLLKLNALFCQSFPFLCGIIWTWF